MNYNQGEIMMKEAVLSNSMLRTLLFILTISAFEGRQNATNSRSSDPHRSGRS
jgi:hypothetical protein